MVTTHRAAPLVFQDPVDFFDGSHVSGVEERLLHALNPLDKVSTDPHTLLNPPKLSSIVPSPSKNIHHSSSPPSALTKSNLHAVSFPPPSQSASAAESPMKRPQATPRRAHTLSKKVDSFTIFDSSSTFDKENIPSGGDLPQYASSGCANKQTLKRALSDATPLRDRSNKKQKVHATEKIPLPEPHEMPAIEDDGAKPSHSYAKLIAMAILRSPNRRLTLAQIYKWISDTYRWYAVAESGWQNSIRHNLSLNKAFIKIDRPKDDPGKGHYWAIEPGMEYTFLQEKPRRATNSDTLMQAPTSDARPSTAPSGGSATHHGKSLKSIDTSKFPDDAELSSDATIPCSDPDLHDGHNAENMPPRPRNIRSSPPPVDIRSSPPQPLSRHALHEDTPPRGPRFPSTSRSGGKRREFAPVPLGDSGYYSSIESSAVKRQPLGTLLTSEADVERPSMKRGRAEEEIARIRGSSYESPTKNRPMMKPPAPICPSSSPYRSYNTSMETPLTPAVVFKRPARPPMSVSPNTSLRNHRDRMKEIMGGSPDKSLAVMDSSFAGSPWPWSPACALPDDENFNLHEQRFHEFFDVFSGSPVACGSPEKRSAKRPGLERANTTASILADITGMKTNARALPPAPALKSPFMKFTSLESPLKTRSPSKVHAPSKSVSFNPHTDEFFGINLPSDESEEAGFDMLQGFEKIGAAAISHGSPMRHARPPMGRSTTSLF